MKLNASIVNRVAQLLFLLCVSSSAWAQVGTGATTSQTRPVHFGMTVVGSYIPPAENTAVVGGEFVALRSTSGGADNRFSAMFYHRWADDISSNDVVLGIWERRMHFGAHYTPGLGLVVGYGHTKNTDRTTENVGIGGVALSPGMFTFGARRQFEVGLGGFFAIKSNGGGIPALFVRLGALW